MSEREELQTKTVAASGTVAAGEGTAADWRDAVRWYVMYCHHRSEGVARAALESSGMEFFQARSLVVRTVGGRKQKVLRSAIPGYFFARGSYNGLKPYTQGESRVPLSFKLNICDLRGEKYMVVPDREMRNFMTVARAYDQHPQYLSVDDPELHERLRKGVRVRVIGGVFDGYDGMFVQLRRGQRRQLVVVLNGVTAITAKVDPDFVEIVEENTRK